MDKRVKKMWIKALRSRKFKKGKGHLRHKKRGSVRHCCLGVLCEIAPKDVYNFEGYTTATRNNKFPNNHEFLPMEVMWWAGLHDGDPYTNVRAIYGYQKTLSDLNDGNYTHAQIADIIEKDL